MKLKNIIFAGCSVITVAALLYSCVKERGIEVAVESNDFSNKAFVQVFNASVGTVRNYVYVDGKTLTGAVVPYGSSFPSVASTFTVSSGPHSFLIRDTLASSTQPQVAFAANFDGKSSYTIFLYDTLALVKQITVKNEIVVPSDTTARVRLANFVLSKTAAGSIDLYSISRKANVFSGVSVTGVTDYIPFASRAVDSLIVRAAGTQVALDTLTFNPTAKRSYTLIFRGRYLTNEAGGAANPRVLSSFSTN